MEVSNRFPVHSIPITLFSNQIDPPPIPKVTSQQTLLLQPVIQHQLNSKDVEAIADRAHVWSVWGKPEKAIYGYEQALRLSPPQPEVYLLRLAEECLRTCWSVFVRGCVHNTCMRRVEPECVWICV